MIQLNLTVSEFVSHFLAVEENIFVLKNNIVLFNGNVHEFYHRGSDAWNEVVGRVSVENGTLCLVCSK